MRYAVVSDVHSNLEALDAVLADISRSNADEVLFLGDAVGYGADPGACLELLGENCAECIAGNHDWAVLGLTDTAYFNPAARAAVEWTAGMLKDKGMKALSAMPLVKSLEEFEGGLLMVHSTPTEPDKWHYIFSPSQAGQFFSAFTERVCLVGHSHVPFVAELLDSGKINGYDNEVTLKPGARYIINTGSVGQPRDHDPRASYLLLDDGRAEIRRVQYDIESAQRKIREAGLPPSLADRLSEGL